MWEEGWGHTRDRDDTGDGDKAGWRVRRVLETEEEARASMTSRSGSNLASAPKSGRRGVGFSVKNGDSGNGGTVGEGQSDGIDAVKSRAQDLEKFATHTSIYIYN